MSGTRHSTQRDAILTLLRSTKTHPTAEWVYFSLKEDFPSLGIATVYRNLKLFEKQGLVQRIDVGDGYDHYDADISQHYHFHCTSCRQVLDLDMPKLEFDSCLPEGHIAEHHQLVFFGKCCKCNEEQCS
ncbi:MAG: transcriptional repressor [Clostridia bacterium]|nr:transcriptional repressor [Clostridia bacterium]